MPSFSEMIKEIPNNASVFAKVKKKPYEVPLSKINIPVKDGSVKEAFIDENKDLIASLQVAGTNSILPIVFGKGFGPGEDEDENYDIVTNEKMVHACRAANLKTIWVFLGKTDEEVSELNQIALSYDQNAQPAREYVAFVKFDAQTNSEFEFKFKLPSEVNNEIEIEKAARKRVFEGCFTWEEWVDEDQTDIEPGKAIHNVAIKENSSQEVSESDFLVHKDTLAAEIELLAIKLAQTLFSVRWERAEEDEKETQALKDRFQNPPQEKDVKEALLFAFEKAEKACESGRLMIDLILSLYNGSRVVQLSDFSTLTKKEFRFVEILLEFFGLKGREMSCYVDSDVLIKFYNEHYREPDTEVSELRTLLTKYEQERAELAKKYETVINAQMPILAERNSLRKELDEAQNAASKLYEPAPIMTLDSLNYVVNSVKDLRELSLDMILKGSSQYDFKALFKTWKVGGLTPKEIGTRLLNEKGIGRLLINKGVVSVHALSGTTITLYLKGLNKKVVPNQLEIPSPKVKDGDALKLEARSDAKNDHVESGDVPKMAFENVNDLRKRAGDVELDGKDLRDMIRDLDYEGKKGDEIAGILFDQGVGRWVKDTYQPLLTRTIGCFIKQPWFLYSN